MIKISSNKLFITKKGNVQGLRGDITSPNNNESAIIGGEAITWIRMASVENKWVIYKLSGN
jgi:hypothetical protein